MSTSTVSRKVGKKSANVVVQNITIKQTNRKTQDIENWRNAIKRFENLENPSRVLLYDLYSDITLDGQIESTWGKRQDSIINKDLLFVKDGKEDEEINKLLNSPSMRLLLKEIHNSVMWGYTLVQVNDIYYNEEEEQYVVDFDLIPRKHVHPEKNLECISKDQTQPTKDILYKEPPEVKYMLWAGEPTDMGLLVKAAQYVIYKRGNFGDWAQYAEIFGMPFREAKYDGFDEDTRIKLEQALEKMGGASYLVTPKNAEITIHEASSQGGSTTLYKDLMNACNAEISKIILGNTLTTEQGDKGTQALGTVHKDIEGEKKKGDEKLVIDVLNGKFRAILKQFGFNVQGGMIWFKSPDADWELLQKKWAVISGIANKVPVADDYIYEEFDIPKPENYDELKEQMQTKPELSHIDFKDIFSEKSNKTLFSKVLDFFF